jgi:hypothetical protein
LPEPAISTDPVDVPVPEDANLGGLQTTKLESGAAAGSNAAATLTSVDSEEAVDLVAVAPATIIGARGLDGLLMNDTFSDAEADSVCGVDTLDLSSFPQVNFLFPPPMCFCNS